MPQLSVIIPIYRVEKYIEQCARSLFEQTLNDLEYIFINDCSPDHSIEVLQHVLEEYPHRKAQVKILHNKQNLGQSGTRYRGIKLATGDYIIHCDSDDWIDKDYYHAIIQKINETQAEIIICDYITEYVNQRKVIKYDNFSHPHDRIRMKRQLLWSLCCTAIKRTLIEKYEIYPPRGINMTEDFNMLVRACYYAKTITNMHGPMYHYRCDRSDSIVNTSKKSQKILLEQRKSLQQIVDFLIEKNFDAGEGMLISKRNMRDFFLFINDYNNWKQTFPEVVDYVYNDISISKVYRILYKLGSEHWLLPFKIYRFISILKNKQR